MVPGESDVKINDSEIYLYTNALASNNGFRRLGKNDKAKLKNPDLVFPGELLKLPDQRLAKVRPGQYIWDIAKTHYKKDVARLQILARQIHKLESEPEVSTNRNNILIIQLKKIMSRLAVTPGMKAVIPE